jgi:uncharacterized protein
VIIALATSLLAESSHERCRLPGQERTCFEAMIYTRAHANNNRIAMRAGPIRLLRTVLGCGVLVSFANTAAETTSPAPTQAYTQITEQGLAAHLYLPSGSGPFPTIIALGGSEGGFITGDAYGQLLPQDGFAVFGLAYFAAEGLPPAIDRIPLEYVIKAVDYIERDARFDRQNIGLVGGSKGGELALLLAAHEPRIHAVCAIVPSNVIWQSARLVNSPTSSWTYRGVQFPFVPYKGPLMPASRRLTDLFELSLLQPSAVAAATIPVENIGGAILLISAMQDEIWPSKHMSERIVARLAEQHFHHSVQHLTYDTGHGFSRALAPEVNSKIVQFFKATLTAPSGDKSAQR